jgi:hypothetical protein
MTKGTVLQHPNVTELPDEPADAQTQEEIFWDAVKFAFAKCEDLVKVRGTSYDRASILDRWPFGWKSIYTLIHIKQQRLLSCLQAGDEGAFTDEKIDDCILDEMNYLAFLYAFVQLQRCLPENGKHDEVHTHSANHATA